MQSINYTKETGRLKTFHLEEELETILKVDKNKPSSRVVRTKKGKKAIAGLIDLEENHNHSWYRELQIRSFKDPNALALFYRGNKINFIEMFNKADDVALALASMGVEKGDEIPCCLSNTPELVYIMLAANKIGAKLNLFGSHLNKDYLNQILDSCSNKVFIGTDDVYGDIKDIISNRNYNNKVLVSLADSLPEDPTKTDEYESSLHKYYYYDNKTRYYKLEDNSLLSFSEFIEKGKCYNKEIIDNNDLDTDFLVTYTSGSTRIGFPKQIIHKNRSLITSGRFHDCELSGNPELIGLRGLAHIHTESNTDVITCISDNLMQLWSVALEPEYSKEKALDYVMLNKPNYLNITTSFAIQMAKDYLKDKKFHEDGVGRKLDFLLAMFLVGEGTSKGEEKFLNRFLREARAGSGVNVAGIKLPFTTVSIGGGDCEHGGIYYTLWKSLYEKLNYFRLKNREYGLMPEAFAQVSAFKKLDDGRYEECNFNEYGIIAANSATTMAGYKDNVDATLDLLIRDTMGRDWVSSNVYGYIDEIGGVHVKSRIGHEINFSDGSVVPAFVLEDLVCRDTKNILSCTVTEVLLDNKIIPIMNIEFQPLKNVDELKALKSIRGRCEKELSKEAVDSLCYRVFDNDESFPLTGSGKRNIPAIEKMGLVDVHRLQKGISDLEIDNKNKGYAYSKKRFN